MEIVDTDTFSVAWEHWLEVTNEQECRINERLHMLFDHLTGCGHVLKDLKVTAEEASRVRHMAGPNYHAYIKATLAKHEVTADGT